MKLASPLKGRIQQGTIFSCCSVEGYPGSKGWGIVITARCDLANSKTPLLNYLPVVSISDWLRADGLAVLQTRCISEVDADVEKLLAELGAPPTILLATGVEVALDTLISELDLKQQKAMQVRRDRVVAKWTEARASSATPDSLYNAFPKQYATLIRELMTHRLSGYYYLSRVEPGEPDSCYVVLLRQIGAMPIELAAGLPEGMRKVDAQSRSSRCDHYLSFASTEEMALPVGVTPSPHIEHLLQSFSLLFGRIGLPNTDPGHIARFTIPVNS